MTVPEWRAWILMALDEADDRDDDGQEVIDPKEADAAQIAAMFGAKKVARKGGSGVAQRVPENRGRA
jgi:hypothetical protein